MSDIVIEDQIVAHLEARVEPEGAGRIVLWNRETRREVPYGGCVRFELNDRYLCDEARKADHAELRISSRDENYALFGMYMEGEELVHFTLPGSRKGNAQGSNYAADDAWGVLKLAIPDRPSKEFVGRRTLERDFILLAVRKPKADPSLPQAILFDPKSGVKKEWPI